MWDRKTFSLWWYKRDKEGTYRDGSESPVQSSQLHTTSVPSWAGLQLTVTNGQSVPIAVHTPPPTPILPSPSPLLHLELTFSLATRYYCTEIRDGAVPVQERGHLPRPLIRYGQTFLLVRDRRLLRVGPWLARRRRGSHVDKSIDPIYGTVVYIQSSTYVTKISTVHDASRPPPRVAAPHSIVRYEVHTYLRRSYRPRGGAVCDVYLVPRVPAQSLPPPTDLQLKSHRRALAQSRKYLGWAARTIRISSPYPREGAGELVRW